jgi:hypothetical protein
VFDLKLKCYETAQVGMAQDSVLSPTLFNIFVNDMFGLRLNGIVKMYAFNLYTPSLSQMQLT